MRDIEIDSVHAVMRDIRLPEGMRWKTLHHEDQDTAQQIEEQVYADAIDGPAKVLLEGEDSIVEEEDGDFGDWQCKGVCQLEDVEGLCRNFISLGLKPATLSQKSDIR